MVLEQQQTVGASTAEPEVDTSIVAVVWAPHEQRTAHFARLLKAKLHNIHYFEFQRPLYAPFKYPLQWLKTWQVLFSERPRLVYITNPPIVATACVYIYCKLMGARYIMDTHPPSLYSARWTWAIPIVRWFARRALANITDQERFKRQFESWGAKSIVLQSPPKAQPNADLQASMDPSYFDVAVVNTFAVDEPIDIILEAGRRMPDVRFFITGNTAKGDQSLINSAPPNCVFTGYLRGDDYWQLLMNSRAVMTLTTFPHSLVQGGHDAMMVRKPGLMSRQPALTEYYRKGAVFIENTAEGIVSGVNEIREREQQLIREQFELTVEAGQEWEHNFQQLLNLVRAT